MEKSTVQHHTVSGRNACSYIKRGNSYNCSLAGDLSFSVGPHSKLYHACLGTPGSRDLTAVCLLSYPCYLLPPSASTSPGPVAIYPPGLQEGRHYAGGVGYWHWMSYMGKESGLDLVKSHSPCCLCCKSALYEKQCWVCLLLVGLKLSCYWLICFMMLS